MPCKTLGGVIANNILILPIQHTKAVDAYNKSDAACASIPIHLTKAFLVIFLETLKEVTRWDY